MERDRSRDEKEQQPHRGEPRDDFDKGTGRSGGQGGNMPDDRNQDQGHGTGQGSKGGSNPQKRK